MRSARVGKVAGRMGMGGVSAAGGAVGSVAGQIVALGALFIVAGSLVFGAIVLAAGALRERLARSARAQRLLNRSAAVVFAGLALRLATAQR